jgi:type I restriction enzyme R subunit
VGVLLDHPEEWSPEVLADLRAALHGSAYHFTDRNLQRAFAATGQEVVVDLLSMVKHAALAEARIMTAEERARAAIERASVGQDWTPEQLEWLDRMRRHLVENLSIDRDDFDLVPVLSDRGGWGRAVQIFPSELDVLIGRINRELADL